MQDGSVRRILTVKLHIDLSQTPVQLFNVRIGTGTEQKSAIFKRLNARSAKAKGSPQCRKLVSLVVFTPSMGVNLRFCVENTELTAMNVGNTYPLPRMDEYIESLIKTSFLSKTDCNGGSWQFEIPRADRDKTILFSHHGLFGFIRMRLGLRNAQASFRRPVDTIMSRLRRQFALVYLDSIIVYSKFVTEHWVHTHIVLTLLRETGTALKLSMCSLSDGTVPYLGHAI